MCIRIINTLTNNTSENPVPETSIDEKLAKDFADFFKNKIQKIRDALDHHPTYEPRDTTAHCKMG